jgi:hypothetical protein
VLVALAGLVVLVALAELVVAGLVASEVQEQRMHILHTRGTAQ